jgi:hypothetical protein
MKAAIAVLLALLALIAMTVYAQEPVNPVAPFQNATIEQTEKSIIKALESESPGLQTSAALTVRELKVLMPERSFSCFVIPLMRLVKCEEGERCPRMVAAIALHELHSAIGDYAIAQQAKCTNCPCLKRTCNWLAYYQILEDHPELARPDITGLPTMDALLTSAK